ncbi:MAG TPA: hypothetical protein VKW78_06620 [Terriglobales bacterium]|nr:hypothetical protein [Terriglobales bacterium]
MAGRTSFTKRQKEQARQQRQRDKAERKNQRKLEKESGTADDAAELERLAQEQAALFGTGADEDRNSTSDDEAPEEDRR